MVTFHYNTNLSWFWHLFQLHEIKRFGCFFKSTYICKVLIQYRFVHVYTTYTLYIAFTSLAQELEMKNKKRKTIISTLSNITIICKVAYRITFLWNLIIIKVTPKLFCMYNDWFKVARCWSTNYTSDLP